MALAVEPRRVAERLGGADILKREVRSIVDLERLVEEGLPKAALRHLAIWLTGSRGRQRIIFLVVPPATFKRGGERLSVQASERTERVARLAALAEEVLGSAEAARQFLTAPHPLLDGRTPLEVGVSLGLGARRVEALLESIEHGLAV
jgi:putative toxin-antitoxin system antitoxin component (TIGR02293 family)